MPTCNKKLENRLENMKKKIFKLFGIQVWETEEYRNSEEKPIKIGFRKPQGEVIDITPEEAEKEKDEENIKKMEGK